ncbi:protein MALE DISCOVERER 1-like isoform X2 [Silene latifolia]|uniref:protein MALE DISCOVERER 1-like isoform X2 n=1 Tax=Silene latifolia TaxID=37657 RepID=UPI003D775803
MVERWNPYEIQLSCFIMLAVLSEIRKCDSLNPEGLALLEFRERIEDDPFGAFGNWNPNHSDPCLWLGVQCLDGKVDTLDLSGFSLQGTLSPALKNLRYMRSFVMSRNRLSGSIPKEIGELKFLELLDLSHNNLSGIVPVEIAVMPSLKCLFLCGNDLHDGITSDVGMLDYLLDLECSQQHLSLVTGTKDFIQRSGQCFWLRILTQLKNYFGVDSHLRTRHQKCCLHTDGENCCHSIPSSTEDNTRRRLLKESSNLAAAPVSSAKVSQQGTPAVLRSGAFPAVLKQHIEPPQRTIPEVTQHELKKNPTPNNPPAKFFIFGALLVSSLVASLCVAFIGLRRYRGVKAVNAQNSALLHRLSKVFVTGVPRLNSGELQTACEDFSNIIETFSGCLMYKGILSSGVEIAVLSTSVRSARQWSSHAEREFKKKLETLSKINHKNFVNLLGYCEEQDPFVRMMVFEYAPNGNLYEHLHVKDMDHLDWTTRMRIAMGTCYCLEYMHHEFDPPIVHPNLQSDAILLTDDYAAKVADVCFWADIGVKAKISEGEESEPLHSHPGPTCEDNVYSLGILLLEIISTKSLNMQERSLKLIKFYN